MTSSPPAEHSELLVKRVIDQIGFFSTWLYAQLLGSLPLLIGWASSQPGRSGWGAKEKMNGNMWEWTQSL